MPPIGEYMPLTRTLGEIKDVFGRRFKIDKEVHLWLVNDCLWEKDSDTLEIAIKMANYLKGYCRFDCPLECNHKNAYAEEHKLVLNIKSANSISKNLTNLMKLDDESLLLNAEPFECPICFDQVLSKDGVVLHECLHTFCR